MRSATLTIVATGQSATTDNAGHFTLRLVPAGAQSLRIRVPGYPPAVRSMVVRAGESTTIDVVIGRAATMLGAARADATPADRERFDARPNVGTVTLTSRDMQAVPRLGEADPVRVVQFLPGVQGKNDFSSGFSVRGGESDQNLILLDGYPVYNPFHLGNSVSAAVGTFLDGELRLGFLRSQGLADTVDVLRATLRGDTLVGTFGKGAPARYPRRKP